MPVFDRSKFKAKKFFFPIQMLGWKILGFWPGSKHISKLQLAFILFNVFEVLIYGTFQLNFCYQNRENLVVVLDAMTPLATQLTTSIKILVIVAWRNELKQVLDSLRECFLDGEVNELLEIR
jgi:hypothetical protein